MYFCFINQIIFWILGVEYIGWTFHSNLTDTCRLCSLEDTACYIWLKLQLPSNTDVLMHTFGFTSQKRELEHRIAKASSLSRPLLSHVPALICPQGNEQWWQLQAGYYLLQHDCASWSGARVALPWMIWKANPASPACLAVPMQGELCSTSAETQPVRSITLVPRSLPPLYMISST